MCFFAYAASTSKDNVSFLSSSYMCVIFCRQTSFDTRPKSSKSWIENRPHVYFVSAQWTTVLLGKNYMFKNIIINVTTLVTIKLIKRHYSLLKRESMADSYKLSKIIFIYFCLKLMSLLRGLTANPQIYGNGWKFVNNFPFM